MHWGWPLFAAFPRLAWRPAQPPELENQRSVVPSTSSGKAEPGLCSCLMLLTAGGAEPQRPSARSGGCAPCAWLIPIVSPMKTLPWFPALVCAWTKKIEKGIKYWKKDKILGLNRVIEPAWGVQVGKLSHN